MGGFRLATVIAVVLALPLVPASASGGGNASERTARAVAPRLAGDALVRALRGGGYVVYFRHAATDFSMSDTDARSST